MIDHNGAPGLRSQYHPNYYGAFVLDPDGNNIEAVCRTRRKISPSIGRTASDKMGL